MSQLGVENRILTLYSQYKYSYEKEVYKEGLFYRPFEKKKRKDYNQQYSFLFFIIFETKIIGGISSVWTT
jgi:hypothetical protein